MTFSNLLLPAYFIVIFFVAQFFSRRVQNLEDFFLAGRKLGAFPVALALAASWVGAASTLGSIDAFHNEGLSGAWRLIIPSIGSFFFITLFMAKPVSRQPYLSQPEAVEAAYGKAGRLLLACVILVATTVLIGSQLVAAGKVCQAVFGMDVTTATLLSATAVVSYAIWGGYFTVVVTDMAQISFVLTGFFILFLFTAWQTLSVPHGLPNLILHQPPHFWEWNYHWEKQILLVITFILAWSIAPEMWQRMSSTRNPDLAFRAGWQAGLLITLLFCIIMGIGLFSSHLTNQHSAVLVTLALNMPFPLLGSFVLLGFVAAVTSTMDSSLNVGSLTLTRDIYQGFLRPQASDQECLLVGRITTLLMILPAVAIALYFQDIIQILWVSADIYASCMFFPIMGILYSKRPARLSGILGILFGAMIVILNTCIQNKIVPTPLYWPEASNSTLLGIGFSGLGYALGALLAKRQGSRPVRG